MWWCCSDSSADVVFVASGIAGALVCVLAGTGRGVNNGVSGVAAFLNYVDTGANQGCECWWLVLLLLAFLGLLFT